MSEHRSKTPFALALIGALMLIWSSAPTVTAARPDTGPAHALRAAAPHALNVAAANAVLRREVFGFFNYSSMGDPSVGYPSWNFKLLSTVAYFRLQVNSGNGYIVPGTDPGWVNFHSTLLSNLISYAHSYGTRVIVSVNLHDMSSSPTNQVCTGLIKANYTNTITETLQLIQQMNMDGVNLNYEASNVSCAATSDPTDPLTSRDRFTNFVAAFRQAMPSPAYLAVDTFSGAAEDNLEFFNVTGIAPNVDAMFVMAYDMDWANYSEVPLNCSSYCFNPVSPLNTYRFNAMKSMQQYTALVPSSKVILGQPYYGSRGCVAGSSPAHQTLKSNYVNTTYIYASTIASQSGVSYLSKSRDPSDGVSEWDTWWDTDWNCWREQYFDDVISLGAKYDVVNSLNLRGVGIFTLDYGGGSPELWHELDLKFATTTPWNLLGGVIRGDPVATATDTNHVNVFIRGSDDRLWHRSWDGTTWSNWESLDGVLGSGPSAVATSTTRLDVFIRGQEGGLWHRWWNGTAWSSWESLGGVLNGAPSAVVSGSNIAVFIRGSDNGLWQRTWNGTSWSAWQSLGGYATASPTAASVGSTRIDLFHRGTDYGLWARSWDSTQGWGAWKSLGGVLPADPIAVVDASNRIDVFARGTDNGLWQQSWNGNFWGGWTAHGGLLMSAPVATTCSAGHIDTFHIGSDAAIWQQGFNGTAWGNWQRLGGQWTADPAGVCPAGATSVNLFGLDYNRALWQTAVPAT